LPAGQSSFERLSQLDRSFLLLETESAHMHVAALQIFEPGSLASADGILDIERLTAYIQSRLHLIPRYRQRIVATPLEGHPVWIDDATFNIRYHVRHTALPRPGSGEQLKSLVGRLVSQQLDRSKPLWEMWIIEGLESGRFAIFCKTHHCMIDGISGVDIMNVLMDTEPRDGVFDPLPWQPRPEPSTFDLMLGAVEQRVLLPREILAGYARRRGELVERATALVRTLATSFQSATPTPINGTIGPHRRFAHVSIALEDVKRVKRALGGSLNDVVLAVVTGAVRRLLESRRFHVQGLAFRVMAPVSTRSSAERGSLGNRVSSWFVDLPIDERDPARALGKIAAVTARLKETNEALGAEVLTRVSEWTGGTLLNLGTQLAKNTLTFNTVVTNVPGPQVPLYLLGARMEEAYPVVPLFVGQGIGIALFSYGGRLFWGINADWDLMPDVERFAEYLTEAFRELAVAAGVEPHAAASATTRDRTPLQGESVRTTRFAEDRGNR
jgi:diacylglycerol O-acyltransferase